MTFVPGSSSRLLEVLERQGPDRLDLVVVEVGAEHDVGEDLQGGDQVAAEGRGRDAGVERLGPLAVADAQVVERRQSSSRLSRSPAPRVIHSASIEAAPPRPSGLVRRAGRQQERERRRLDARHRLGHEHQAVGELVLR